MLVCLLCRLTESAAVGRQDFVEVQDGRYQRSASGVAFFAWLRFGYPKIQKRGSFP